jgi:CelD/BcsL family acetyltransferase involved in cellulose biosynthesis
MRRGADFRPGPDPRCAVPLRRLERSGWKAEAGIGVAKDEAHRAFYEDLLPRLAAKGQAVVCFLKSGGEDMAGVINFIRKDVIFGRHTAYSPSHAAHSPGVLLRVECIRDAFGKAFREFDFLTMKGDGASNAKSDWANRRRETVDWTGYRASGRLLPLVAAKRLKRLLGHESGRRGEER